MPEHFDFQKMIINQINDWRNSYSFFCRIIITKHIQLEIQNKKIYHIFIFISIGINLRDLIIILEIYLKSYL